MNVFNVDEFWELKQDDVRMFVLVVLSETS